MDFTKEDFCSVFVIVNSHCCCCPQKDCVNEVGKNFQYLQKVVYYGHLVISIESIEIIYFRMLFKIFKVL